MFAQPLKSRAWSYNATTRGRMQKYPHTPKKKKKKFCCTLEKPIMVIFASLHLNRQ